MGYSKIALLLTVLGVMTTRCESASTDDTERRNDGIGRRLDSLMLHEEDADMYEAGSRIPGGNNAKISELPYQVRLMGVYPWKLTGHCGGSIVHPRWILTAAHCVGKASVQHECPFSGGVTILAGTTNISKRNRDRGYQERRVEKESIFLYPLLEGRRSLCKHGAGDLALLKMTEPLVMTDKIRMIKILDYGRKIYDRHATISGWGENYSKKFPDHLQKGDVTIGPVIEKNGIVTLKSTEGASACYGDSGGPAVTNNCVGRYDCKLLVGVASYVSGFCGRNVGVAMSSGYVNLINYIDWIKATMYPDVDCDDEKQCVTTIDGY